jgi:hypothetical protein
MLVETFKKLNKMKKLLIIIGLMFGVSSLGYSQSANVNGIEYKVFKKKTKRTKQLTHFEKQKKDKKIKYNGASYKKEAVSRCVDGNSFKSPKKYKERKKVKVKTNDFY